MHIKYHVTIIFIEDQIVWNTTDPYEITSSAILAFYVTS